jgi:aryl-alcohol dehydrogenase-like predicted oxidoreductase
LSGGARGLGVIARGCFAGGLLKETFDTPGISVTLLGMRSETHLRENLRHFQARPLDAEEYVAVRRVQELEFRLT